jgi:hypothetical protein
LNINQMGGLLWRCASAIRALEFDFLNVPQKEKRETAIYRYFFRKLYLESLFHQLNFSCSLIHIFLQRISPSLLLLPLKLPFAFAPWTPQTGNSLPCYLPLVFLFLLACSGLNSAAYTLKKSTGSCGCWPVISWKAQVEM